MVFTNSDLIPKGDGSKDIGVVTIRMTGKYLGLLLIESLFGLLVGLSNLIVIIILVLGWKRLMKNHFYIVLSNLIVCTSLKAFVEFAFIVPYYVMQGSGEIQTYPVRNLDGKDWRRGYFTTQYEFLIFNVSVFADYGVLFFSLLIAINRFITVARAPEDARTPQRNQAHIYPYFQSVDLCNRIKTLMSCCLVWLCSSLIPVCFYVCKCQYEYDTKLKLYRNKCANLYDNDVLIALIDCLIYLSYACTAVVLVLYLLILITLRMQRQKLHKSGKTSSIPRAQLQLLKQSVVVFALYAASIISVFAMSFLNVKVMQGFDIAYIENLLNLSIAAVYPICFLAMSGEMRSVIARKFIPRSSFVSSIRSSSNNIRVARNETTPS